MTACCDTDVTVFGHVSADCPHTSLPPLDVTARAEHIRWLDQLAGLREPRLTADVRADISGAQFRHHFRRLARSRT